MPTLRLDHLDDRRRLQQTVERIAPRLLILDPLVRLHGVDENAVADVAPKALADATTPLSQRQIRERAATRHKTVGAVLQKLVGKGRVRRDAEGRHSLVASQSEKTAPAANGSDPDAAHPPVPAAHA